MRTVRVVCWLALLVGASFYRLDGAGAQGSPEAQQACTPDAMRLCSEFIPDVAKVTACMMAKRSQLSEACRVAMRGGKSERHEARHRRYYRHCRHHCG
jgi:hypothetical protein